MQVGALNSGLPIHELGIISVTVVYKIMNLVKTQKCRKRKEFQIGLRDTNTFQLIFSLTSLSQFETTKISFVIDVQTASVQLENNSYLLQSLAICFI